MQLDELPNCLLPVFPLGKLRGVDAACVYYCFRGRNAYWGVWTTHYFPGCMHSSLTSAKEFAESLRKQGSVFEIAQLPAVYLDGAINSVLITQINTDQPLTDFLRPVHTRLVPGESLAEIVQSFAPDGGFWRCPQPPRDSVVRLLGWKPHDALEPLGRGRLRRWTSKSRGVNYPLEWSEKNAGCSPHAVLNLRDLAAAQSITEPH